MARPTVQARSSLLAMGPTPRLVRVGLAAAGLGGLLALASMARLGTSMRYSGDDYCSAAGLTRYGFFDVQWAPYFEPGPYGGNRYSATWAASVAGLLPPAGSGLIPGLVLVGLCLALAGLLSRVSQAWDLEISNMERFSIASVLVFLTGYQAPDFVQSILWRAGLLPYLAPLLGQTLLARLLMSRSPEATRPMRMIGIGGLAVLSGGFSETAAALQVCWLSLFVAAGALAVPRRLRASRLVALLGSAWLWSCWLYPLLTQATGRSSPSVFPSARRSP